MNTILHNPAVLLAGCVGALLATASQAVALEVVELKVKAAPAIAVDVPAVEWLDANQQLRAQYEPTVKVELSFAIRACKLEGEQRKQLVAAADEWLNEYVGKMGNQQQNPRGIQIFNGRVRHDGQALDPREAIRKGVASVCKKVLTAEQFAAYEKECEQREQAFRQAIAAILVSRMDEKLVLSAEQREKLTESIVEKWNATWAPPLEMFMYNNEYWPSIPDKVVSPHLTPAQWEIWTRITKNSPNVHFGVNLGNEGQVIDDVEFERPKEKDKKEKKGKKEQPRADGVLQFEVAPRE